MTPTTDTIIRDDYAAMAAQIHVTQRQYTEAQTAPRIIAALADTLSIKGGCMAGHFHISRRPEDFLVRYKRYEYHDTGTTVNAPITIATETLDEALQAMPEMHDVAEWFSVK